MSKGIFVVMEQRYGKVQNVGLGSNGTEIRQGSERRSGTCW